MWEPLLFFDRDLTTATVTSVTTKVPVEIRLATEAEVLEFPSSRPGEGARRLERGDVCVVGVIEGRIIHQTWITTRPTYIPEAAARIRLQPDEAYLYASFTEPPARGAGVQAAVSSFVVRYNRERGVTRHFLYVRWRNASARQVLKRIQPPMRLVRVLKSLVVGGRGYLVSGFVPNDPLFER